MRVWRGLENQRMEGEEEKDAGLSGKGDRNTENVSREEPSGPPVKATGTRKARPINRGKARRYAEKDGDVKSPLQKEEERFLALPPSASLREGERAKSRSL